MLVLLSDPYYLTQGLQVHLYQFQIVKLVINYRVTHQDV